MWAFLDFVARLICVGGFVLVGWGLYQVTRETSARACIGCGYPLNHSDIATCARCLDPDLSNECELCGGGRSVPVAGQWCEDLQVHATISARENSRVAR